MRKICIISSNVFAVGASGLPGYGGLEQIAWECARGLAAMGHQVALVAPDGSSCPGVTIIPSGPAGQWDERMAFGGVPNQRDGYWQQLLQFDAVIDHSWQKWAYQIKAEGALKAPVLGVCHAPINTMFQSGPPPRVPKPCIVCISKDQASHYEALYSPHKARVAYNGIDLDLYKSTGMKRTNRFLFLARFSSIKGPDLAIEACRRAGVGLDLVGDSSITNEPDYLQKVRSMCDGKQIRMIGAVSRGEAVWWMSQAHAFIHPNQRFREPFGLAPVEAQACSLPVVAWNYGAMSETMKNRETALLVEDVEQLAHAVHETANMNITSEMRAACRANAERFSLRNMVRTYSDLVEEAIDTGGW